MNKQNKTKNVTFSERSLDMIEAIMNETGYKTTSQVVTRAIEELYKSTFKYGKDPLSGAGMTPKEEDIEEFAKRKAKQKNAIINAEIEEKLSHKTHICKRILLGDVTTNDNGDKFCEYTQFTLTGNNLQKIPLKQCDPHIAETSLFLPSKESVFRSRPEVENLFKQ